MSSTAAAAALGFATIENWYYMIDTDEVVWHPGGHPALQPRILLELLEVGLSLYYTRESRRAFWLGIGLILSFVYHGLYDYILLSHDMPPSAVLPLVFILWLWLMVAIPKLRQTAPSPPPDHSEAHP
ncbi:MAG: PrsW family glutamic-type intramembrane protease [Myxococcota bacterium]